MIALGLLLALVMGTTLGLFGGGGSILTVPICVYVLGMSAKSAIATSLLVVGVTSLAGAIQHARAGAVRWRMAAVFGCAAMLGSYGGGKIAAYLSAPLLMALFAVMMLVTAGAMLRGRTEGWSGSSHRLPWTLAATVEGLLVGVFTGLVGAGGGFLVVPALMLLGGLEMRAAIGTSLLIIAMKSFAGLAGYLEHVAIDVPLAASLAAAAVVGSSAGAAVSHRASADTLRHGFAWLVVAMGSVMLTAQIPPELRWPLVGALGFALGVHAGMRIGDRRALAQRPHTLAVSVSP